MAYYYYYNFEKYYVEAYLEPCHSSKMALFAKRVIGEKPLN